MAAAAVQSPVSASQYAAYDATKYSGYIPGIYNPVGLYGATSSPVVSAADTSKVGSMSFDTQSIAGSSSDLSSSDSKYGILEKSSSLFSAPSYEKSLEHKEVEMKSESPIPSQVSSSAYGLSGYYSGSGFPGSAFQPSSGLGQVPSLLQSSQMAGYGGAPQYPPSSSDRRPLSVIL